jgi:4-amino-4-deoxy-L-arabinose transferase-like glycosyltransferase
MAVARPAAGPSARRPAAGAIAAAWSAVVPEAAVLALAAVLRVVALGGVPTNPYYDAAVRSMGTSWAAFFAGAFEPGRRVAIDKPPVDLWLQVASTHLLGFGPVGLLLPEALGGIALVGALMWLLRVLVGRRAALAGGLALAVLPSAVVVARSDTMDAVMAVLATAGVALVARAARTGRLRPLLGAGVLLGLAFDVKLAEALLGLAAAIALWLAAGPRRARLRLAGLGLGGGAFAVTALAWLVAVTIVPLHPRPWALGASDGSPWRAAFVYNGIDRLLPGDATAADGPTTTPATTRAVSPREAAALARRAREHAAALARRPAAPGPLRLLSTNAHLRTWIGIEAVAALAALAVALALGAHRSLDRVGRAGLLVLGFWLVAGIALCSVMPALRPRYLACLDPAVAGGLGAGVALASRRAPRAAAGALCAVLALPLGTSIAAVAHGTQDAGRTGAMRPSRVAALSAYLRANDGGAANEVAASAPAKVGPLVARDGRPVLILSDGQGNQLVTPSRLAAAVGAGQVRFALLGDACTAASGNERTGCLPVMRWARRHGVDVSRAAGQPHPGLLYALVPPVRGAVTRSAAGTVTRRAAGAAASGRTPRSATSRRRARAGASSAGRRASRARRGRAARARRASRRRSSARRSR